MYFANLQHFKTKSGYEIDGKWYPRVTAIVSIKAKPGLYRYYAEQESFKAAEQKTRLSAQEGTLIHDTVEAILKNEQPQVSEQIQPVISAFLDFLEKNEMVPLRIEERIKNEKYHYAGTADFLARLNGVLGVVDVKTSVSIFRDYNLQTAAYAEAYQEAGHSDLSRWILRLDQSRPCLKCGARMRTKGGNVKIRGGDSSCSHLWGGLEGEAELKKLEGLEKDFKAFLAAKDLWEWENEYWLAKAL